MAADGPHSRLRDDRALQGLLVVTAVALAARLVTLGTRVAHWDEGRVGYDILRYMATGWWEYRPIVHGPFLPQVNKHVLGVLGPTDFGARLVVALVGGLLPLAALLFRDRLRDSEVVALGALLALNPILLYYSRFMRNDVLVGAFAFVALGYFVRAHDRGSTLSLYGGAVALALSFTAKENALLYVVCWIGGAVLLLDHRLFRASERAARARERLGGAVAAGVGRGRSGGTDAEASAPGVDGDGAAVGGSDSPATDGDTVGGASAGTDPDTAPDADTPPTSDSDADVTSSDTEGEMSEDLAPGTRSSDLEVLGESVVRDDDADADGGATDGGTDALDASDDHSDDGPDDGGTDEDVDDPRPDGGTVAGTSAAEVRDWPEELKAYGTRALDGLVDWRVPLALALVQFLAVLVFFYAPRAGSPTGLGLWNAFGNPSMIPAVLDEALVGSAQKLVGTWISGSHQDHAYLPFLRHYVDTLLAAAGPLLAFAVLGFVADRYAEDGPRDVVALGGYWGFVSILGYPIATDINAGWATVHAVIPLALPAAVGIALVFRWGIEALDNDDEVSTGLAALVLVVALALTASTAAGLVYQNPQADSNPLVQYGQPAGEMKGTLADVQAAAAGNSGGPDVLFYGDHFYVENESEAYRLPVDNNDGSEQNGNWYHRLPLPWYLEAGNATTDSVRREADLDAALEGDQPPVIVVRRCGNHWDAQQNACSGENLKNLVDSKIEGYHVVEYKLTSSDTWTAFFVEEEYVAEGPA